MKTDQKCVPCIHKKSDSNNQSLHTNAVEFDNSSLGPDQKLLKQVKKIVINIDKNEKIKVVTNKCCKKEETEEENNLYRCVDDLYYTHHPSMLCTAVKFDNSVIMTEGAIVESTPRADPGYCRKSMKGDEDQIDATLQEIVEGGKELKAQSGRAVGADFTERRCVCWWLKRKRERKRKSDSPTNDSTGGRAGLVIVEDREGVEVADGVRIGLTDKLERKEEVEAVAEGETEKSGQKDTDNNGVGDVENKKEKDVNTGTEDIFHINDIEYGGTRGGEDSICVIDSLTGLRSTTGEINGGLEDEMGLIPLNSRDARDCLGRQNDGYGGDIEKLYQDRNIDEFGRNGTNENCISKNNNIIKFCDEDRKDSDTNCKGVSHSPHVIKGILPISSYALFNDFKMLLKRCLLVQNHWERTRSGSSFRLIPSSASATSSSSSNSSITLLPNVEYCCKDKSRNERSTNHGSRSRDDYDINNVNYNEKYNSIIESELETFDEGVIWGRNRGQSRAHYLSEACGEEECNYVHDIKEKEKEKEKGKEDIDGNNKRAEALTMIDPLSMSSSQVCGIIDKMMYAHTKCHSLLRLDLSQKYINRQVDDNEIKDEDQSLLSQRKFQAPRVLLKFLVLPANIVNSRKNKNNGRLKSIYDDIVAEETVGSLIGYKSERMSLLHPTRAEIGNENKNEREGKKGKIEGEINNEEDIEDSEDSTISAKRKEIDSDTDTDADSETETDIETQINVYTSSRNILFSHPKLFPDWIRKSDYL